MEFNVDSVLLFHQINVLFLELLLDFRGFLKFLFHLVHFFQFLLHLILSTGNVQHWLDLGVQFPPLPVSQNEPFTDVSLNHGKSSSLVLQLLVLFAHQITSNVSLESRNNGRQAFVTHFLKHTEYTGFEEDLGVTKTVLCGVELQSKQNLFRDGLAINEALWNSIGSQDGISLFEFRVDDSAGESFTTNSDTLKYTVTLELVQDQGGIDHAGLFHFVGNDTTHKMRVSAVQVLHQFVQGFPVNSRDGLESRRLLLLLTATLFYGGCLEEFLHKVFLGSRQKSHNVLVDWILVLLQPVGDVVSHRASVMTQREVRGWDSGPGRLSWFAKVG